MSMQAMLTFCCHEFEKDGQLDTWKSPEMA
jgi:hypothetical protein